MTIKTLRTDSDGMFSRSKLQVVGFHGRLGVDQTPAQRGPVYADPNGHLVTILEASPYGKTGKHALTIEVAAKQISDDIWATTGTRIRPPWPAKLGDCVVIIGEREVGYAQELVANAKADNDPERVVAFLRWLTTSTNRSDELCCARVDDLVAWYTNPREIRALRSQIAALVRTKVLRCAQQSDPDLRVLASMSFWLSRAAVDDADMILAVAGLRHADFPHWEMVLDAGVQTGSERSRLAAVCSAVK